MLEKHLGLPKFYAPSKVLTLGAEKFSRGGPRIVETFPENLRRKPRDLMPSHHRVDRTVRYEWLSQYLWRDLDEVRDFITDWIWKYNHERTNIALGGITPMQRLAMAA